MPGDPIDTYQKRALIDLLRRTLAELENPQCAEDDLSELVVEAQDWLGLEHYLQTERNLDNPLEVAELLSTFKDGLYADSIHVSEALADYTTTQMAVANEMNQAIASGADNESVASMKSSQLHRLVEAKQVFDERLRKWPEERPAYLGLDVIPAQRRVSRVGFRQRVEFRGNNLYWQLFLAMLSRRDEYLSHESLCEVWTKHGGTDQPESQTVRSAFVAIRKYLKPIKVNVVNARTLGYRLESM